MKVKVERVSIALPTYNGAPFLRKQLESYLAQERLPDELVITDDASTDETLELLDDFSRQAPFPVKLFINPERMGVFRNFEKAMSLCSGDIICFSDQDDIWLPTHLRVLAGEFESGTRVMAVCSNSDQIDGAGINTGVNTWKDVSRLSHKKFKTRVNDAIGLLAAYRGIGNAHGLAIHRDLFTVIMPTAVGRFHGPTLDRLLLYAATLTGSVRFVYRPLTLYRRHGANTSSFVRVSNSQLLRHTADVNHLAAARLTQLLEAFQLVRERTTHLMVDSTTVRYLDVLNHYLHTLRSRQSGLAGVVRLTKLLSDGSYRRNTKGIRDLTADLIALLRRQTSNKSSSSREALISAVYGELQQIDNANMRD